MTTATPRLIPPRRYRRLIERVCERDRAYFVARPDEATRVRPYVPGEWFPLHHPEATHVRVDRLGRGYLGRRLGALDEAGRFSLIDDLIVVDNPAGAPAQPPPDVFEGGEPLAMVDCREGAVTAWEGGQRR